MQVKNKNVLCSTIMYVRMYVFMYVCTYKIQEFHGNCEAVTVTHRHWVHWEVPKSTESLPQAVNGFRSIL
jgi:hypothetical protein